MANTSEPSGEVPAIQARDVTKRFGSNVAVNSVSFDVWKGEVVGFLGPNGSGKTTTMRLLTSFYTPDSGTILIEGVDNQEHDMITRRNIGYLAENNPVYGELLVSEYLDFIADIRGMSIQERRKNLEQAVEETGIAEVLYRPINQLSKGYRQRVGMAQAILHLPDILIMDEPTEGLDPNQRVPIRELIRSVGRDRTVLLSTHVLQEVEATCDRLLIISRGRIVAQGTVGELQAQAVKNSHIDLEVEGDGVEAALRELPHVDGVEGREPVNGHQGYTLSVSGGEDIRSQIFELAKRRGWVLWELHLEKARLQDLFRSLTALQESDGAEAPQEGGEQAGEL